jgi:tetratricopeptide (TPR) repeat protein
MIFTKSVRCATSLTNLGDFHSAVEALGDRWPGLGLEPARNGESDLDYARLLMLCGILTVEIGKFSQVAAQDRGKDLLSKSVRLFGDDPERYMAMFWLATAYVLCGENREALTICDSILADQVADSDIVFRASRTKGLAHLYLGNFRQAEDAFASIEMLLDGVAPASQGKFHLNRGMLYRQTGRLEESLSEHRKAIQAFHAAGSLRLEAAAMNNISVVYTEQGRYAEARAAAQEALGVFVRLRDRGHEAKVWDQIAQIHCHEENFAEMVRCADRAVEILSEGDHEGWLAEALITQGIARARMGIEQAHAALSQALEICDRQGDPKQAETATRAMWEIVRRGNQCRDGMRQRLASLERDVYERVLERHSGHVTPAAHELGCSHQTLLRRLKNRFPELVDKRSPPRQRRRSMAKPH